MKRSNLIALVLTLSAIFCAAPAFAAGETVGGGSALASGETVGGGITTTTSGETVGGGITTSAADGETVGGGFWDWIDQVFSQ